MNAVQKVLILSVGGSCEPIVRAIREAQPDFVYFLCSAGPRGSEKAVDGPGHPCGDARQAVCPACGGKVPLGDPTGRSMVVQAGLAPGSYEKITVDDPDDLTACYTRLADLAAGLSRRHPGEIQVVANYTGGTKTMSVALALAGLLREKWDLALNVGARRDLIKVASGTDVPLVIDKWQVFNRLQVEAVRGCLARFDYAGADQVLAQMSSGPASRDFQRRLQRARQLIRALERWDRFDHQAAYQAFAAVEGLFPEHFVALKRLLGQAKAHGYEKVADLQLNAVRRAHQGRFDDAVARLYRAMELLGQMRLQKAHGLDTSDLKLAALPEELQRRYETRVREDGQVVLGLIDDYELLLGLGDPVGEVYQDWKSKVLNAIKRRNLSISAHGLEPLKDTDYHEVEGVLAGFMQAALKVVGVNLTYLQLPREEIVEHTGLLAVSSND